MRSQSIHWGKTQIHTDITEGVVSKTLGGVEIRGGPYRNNIETRGSGIRVLFIKIIGEGEKKDKKLPRILA